MKGALALFFVVVACVFLTEAKPGRVKCSVKCWEKLPECKQRCSRINMPTRLCYRDCQDQVVACIRDDCGVSEHVDTFEEHAKYD
ncbi:hypothetical protein FGIG_07938 [Fasciola gigantica]|uniref:Uncharacterized protein n=1 Tax=Fasciola gigantica TaxID=46835 RepID=A0A504YTG7_FASGI|nr:hypothetical protein FGIG_07938 [Fasciola gigantica]